MNYRDAVIQARVREGKRELSDEAALALCAGWQSSGSTGWTLAAVASGRWTPDTLTMAYDDTQEIDAYSRGKEFRQDLYRTFKDVPTASTDMLVWSMLGTWSMNGGDND